jgi:hypothetical protein
MNPDALDHRTVRQSPAEFPLRDPKTATEVRPARLAREGDAPKNGFPILFVLALFLAAAGCGSSSALPGDLSRPVPALPEPDLWPGSGTDLPDAPFIRRMPELADVSTWAFTVQDSEAPSAGSADLPYLGTGNGSVFCLLGTRRPLNAVHGLLGPTYQREDPWFCFPDIVWTVLQAGDPVVFQEETLWRVRGSAVILTRERSSRVEMWTVTFAPFPEPWPGTPRPETQTLFRLTCLRNLTGQRLEDLGVQVKIAAGGRVEEGSLTGTAGTRSVRILSLGRAGENRSGALFLPVTLGPEEEACEAFALITSSPAYPEPPALEAVRELTRTDVEQRLLATVRAWQAWCRAGAGLRSPDPRVNDLVEGLSVTDKVQTTIYGGPVQASHYSLVWNRDTYGPMRWFTFTGREAEARGILDYHFAAVRYRGGLANAYPADQDPAAAPPPPTAEEWTDMGTFTGRTAAEGPSFLVLDYERYLLQTGSLESFRPEDLTARLDMLRACVFQQALSEDGLLPFSGDETFRPQMAISFGLGVEYPFERNAWSFASGVLLAAAAEGLARIEEAAAAVLGTDALAPAERARALADRVRTATMNHFWNPAGGYFEPFLLRPDQEPAGAPYGDVDAVPFWVGETFPGTDPEACADVLVQRLLSGQGVFFSPADPALQRLLGSVIGEGIYTGMTPGFTLWTLASTFHPQGETSFNAMDDHADPGGNYPEVVAHDDTSPLMPVYDPVGILGELWARYRSWEGGINAEAILFYLSGYEGDPVRNRIRLAPRLPNRWPFYHLTGLPMGRSRLDLHVERTGLACMRIRADLSPGAAPVTARVVVPGPELAAASLNGGRLDPGTRLGRRWGGTATDLGDLVLVPGENELLFTFQDPLP